jgi:hypothetical protein
MQVGMETTITKDILAETCFTTWYEFHTSIFESRSLSNIRHQYVYYKGNEEKEIELEIAPLMIEALGREEIQVILDKFKLKGPKELADIVKSLHKGLNEKFTMEIVERTEENEIVLRRYVLTLRMVERFLTAGSPVSYY